MAGIHFLQRLGHLPVQVKRRTGGNAGDQFSQITTQTGADLRQGVQIHLCDPALDLADVAHGNLELFGQPLLGPLLFPPPPFDPLPNRSVVYRHVHHPFLFYR